MQTWLKLFGLPVRVDLIFFLVMVLLRPRGGGFDVVLVVAWVAVATVGVFLHELGHALVARRFGRQPVIALHSLGGVTSWQGELTGGKRLLVSVAGPAVGIVLGGAAMVVRGSLSLPAGSRGDVVLGYVVWANLGWALFNLLPVLPMDGGKVMASVMELLFGPRGMTAARAVSIVLAVLLAVLFVSVGAFFGLVLCVLFAWSNVQGLREPRPSAG